MIGTVIKSTKLIQNGHDRAINSPGMNKVIMARPTMIAMPRTGIAKSVKINAMNPKPIKNNKNLSTRNIGITATNNRKRSTAPTSAIILKIG